MNVFRSSIQTSVSEAKVILGSETYLGIVTTELWEALVLAAIDNSIPRSIQITRCYK